MVGSGSRWEFVSLAASVRIGEGVAWAVSCLRGYDAVGALNQIHEVGLDVSCATVALAVQANGNNAGEEAVIVRLLDGCFVISLLRRVAVLGSFVGNRNHDLCSVRVPTVVRLGWRVAWNVAGSVFPREASPV